MKKDDGVSLKLPFSCSLAHPAGRQASKSSVYLHSSCAFTCGALCVGALHSGSNIAEMFSTVILLIKATVSNVLVDMDD